MVGWGVVSTMWLTRRPSILLSLARELLAVTVHDESVEDADRVDRLLSDEEIVLPDGGWNTDAIVALLNQLGDEAPVQEAAITYAARQGGFIDREKVYNIGDYPQSRSLRGFTRPINRVAQLFREEGRIHESAVDLLDTVYDQWSNNPSAAIGFELNSQIASLVVATVSTRSST